MSTVRLRTDPVEVDQKVVRRRPRWLVAPLALCLLVGPLTNVVIVGLIAVALMLPEHTPDRAAIS